MLPDVYNLNVTMDANPGSQIVVPAKENVESVQVLFSSHSPTKNSRVNVESGPSSTNARPPIIILITHSQRERKSVLFIPKIARIPVYLSQSSPPPQVVSRRAGVRSSLDWFWSMNNIL